MRFNKEKVRLSTEPFGIGDSSCQHSHSKGLSMKLIQYTTSPAMADENERLVRAVFSELRATQPAGVRYAVLRLANGGFCHLVRQEPGGPGLTSLAAFQAFQEGIRARVIAPPSSAELKVVGNYRLLDEVMEGIA
jgi:hypothetical protein